MTIELPAGDLQVINIGLESFAQDLKAQGIAVVQLDWRPPAGGDARLAAMLASLDDEDDDDD
ncbi:MAG: hypothetical protein JSW68_02815 [Burkholderiales bacterium]|nr:MAG: hypothetical protein JSW68_02815 [Burkholderiales bacterium]